jgi:serine/threonine-protein kinase HipA
MKRTIQVHLGDAERHVGTLHYDAVGSRERSAFAYHASWLNAPDGFPLEPGLPLFSGPQFRSRTSAGSVFHAVIADTEPDGWAKRVILRDHAKQRQEVRRTGQSPSAAPLNAVDFLLAVDDFSRVGSLRFKDEQGRFCRSAESGRRTVPPLVELGQLLHATRAVEMENETAADLEYLRGRGTSLGGLRPKCSVIDDDGHLAIGKFPSVSDERAVTKGEVLALRLARAAGIDAAAARLIDSDGLPVALIRRFDRTGNHKRILYASAATLVGADPDDGREHFYTEIVDALRVHGADARADCEQLWRRLVFSILITNVDDHLRNHGFLHAGRGLWRLAPAFDINPFPDRVRELKTWPSEETGPEATIDASMAVIAYFGITPSRAQAMLGEVDAAVGRWRAEGRSLGMTPRELDSYADAFEHPQREAARRAL